MKSFAIIPAAGQSRRMGRPKLLLPWKDGRTVIDATLEAWGASQIDEVVIVVRSDDRQLQQQCQSHRVHVVSPQPDPPFMKDSVIAALRWIQERHHPDNRDVWLLAAADSPRLSAEVVNRLLAAHDPDAPAILKPSFHGRRGHPVLFPWALSAATMELEADQGIDALGRSYAVRVIECDEPSVLDDLNTPEDYDLLRHNP